MKLHPVGEEGGDLEGWAGEFYGAEAVAAAPAVLLDPHFGGEVHLLKFFRGDVVQAGALAAGLAIFYLNKVYTLGFLGDDVNLAVTRTPVLLQNFITLLL